MATLVVCQDSPEAPTLRKQYLKAHLEYIEKIMHQVRVAGPLSRSQSARQLGTYDGSCLIYLTDDIDEAKVLFDSDPYTQAGVFAKAEFCRFNPVAGDWVGGKTW